MYNIYIYTTDNIHISNKYICILSVISGTVINYVGILVFCDFFTLLKVESRC